MVMAAGNDLLGGVARNKEREFRSLRCLINDGERANEKKKRDPYAKHDLEPSNHIESI